VGPDGAAARSGQASEVLGGRVVRSGDLLMCPLDVWRRPGLRADLEAHQTDYVLAVAASHHVVTAAGPVERVDRVADM
jgi:hypothetical protein